MKHVRLKFGKCVPKRKYERVSDVGYNKQLIGITSGNKIAFKLRMKLFKYVVLIICAPNLS